MCNAQHLSLFFRKMCALLDSGISLSHALAEMGTRADHGALRRAAAAMSARTATGELWSDAMLPHPTLFSPMAIAVTRGAEQTGNLVEACKLLAEYAEREYNIQQDIKRETWYTKILLFVSTVMLPLPIIIPLGFVTLRIDFLYQLLLLVGGWLTWKVANLLWPFVARPSPNRLLLDRIRLKMPFAGRIIRGFALAKLCRTLGIMIAAGVNLTQSIEMAAMACGNSVLANQLRTTIPPLQHGKTIASALAETGAFSGPIVQMLRTGEEAGAIDAQLKHVAKFMEIDAETALFQTIKTLYVCAYLLVAVKIGSQIISFWTGAH